MKFEYVDFSAKARKAFYEVFEDFCTTGGTPPISAMESLYGACCFHFIKEVKDAIFGDAMKDGEVTVDEFDNLCVEKMHVVVKDTDDILLGIGLTIVIGLIVRNIKKQYKFYNTKEESNGNREDN